MPEMAKKPLPRSSYRADPLHFTPKTRYISSPLAVHVQTTDPRQGVTSLLMANWHHVRHVVTSNAEIYRRYLDQPLEQRYHLHEYYELTYVMEGTIYEWIEDECLILQRGDAILLDRNARHAEQYHNSASCIFFCMDDQCVRDLLANDPPFSEGQSVMRFLMNHLLPESRSVKAYCHFTAAQSKEDILPVEEVANDILDELINKRPGYWLLIQGYLRRILGLLETPSVYRNAPVYKVIGSKNKLASEIQLQIEARQGIISKHELAALMNYNTAYLCQLIKEHFGKSYTEYCLSVRLRSAAQMLRETKWSVTAICDKLGFSNRTYFYKAFEKEYHTTPGNYRSGKR